MDSPQETPEEPSEIEILKVGLQSVLGSVLARLDSLEKDPASLAIKSINDLVTENKILKMKIQDQATRQEG